MRLDVAQRARHGVTSRMVDCVFELIIGMGSVGVSGAAVSICQLLTDRLTRVATVCYPARSSMTPATGIGRSATFDPDLERYFRS